VFLIPVGIVLLVLGVGGVEDSRDDFWSRNAPPIVSVAGKASRATDDATVRLSPRSRDDDRFPSTYDAIDALEPGMVLRVRAEDFAEYAEGIAAQCVHRANAVECGNAFPVQFDADGKAFFQYEVRDDFHANAVAGGRCHADAARCTLVVHDEQRNTTAVIDTVFHDRLPEPGKIRVTPSSGVADGQTVTVAVTGYPAGAQVNAMLCAAPDATGSGRCGAPGPTTPLLVGPDGTGTSKLVVKEGPVGSQRIPCGRDAVCGISVASADVFTRAPVVPVSFASPGGAVYDRNRVAIGLALAIVLIGLAIWFLRRTDWSPVGEVAAPEIDDADYADLDAIIAALPSEDDEPARSP
jgi:Neocarzinostatin family